MRREVVVRLCRFLLALLCLAVLMPSTAAADPKKVNVHAQCPADGGRPEVRVRPWTVSVPQDGEIDWNLHTNNPNNNSIEIEAKDPDRWPYSETKHSGKGSAKAREMKPNAQGIYYYNFTVYCGDGPYRFDPRVKVG